MIDPSEARSFNRFLHGTGELVLGERLPQNRSTATLQMVGKQLVIGIAGHVKHLNIGESRSELLRKFTAAASRHHHIGQQQVDIAFKTIDQVECSSPIRCAVDLISKLLQKSARQVAYLWLIFGQEDCLSRVLL